MKPFSRLLPWVRRCNGHGAQQLVRQGITPAFLNRVALAKLAYEERTTERLAAEKRPTWSYKSGTVDVAYTLPDLEQDLDHDLQEEQLAAIEENWAENAGRKRRPINWNMAAAVYAVAAIAHTIVVFVSLNSSAKAPSAEMIASATAEQQEQIESKATIHDLHTTVRGYLNAGSVKEKLKWVRHPDRVSPLMAGYYQKNSLENRKFRSIKNLRAVTAWSKSFVLLVAELESGGTQFLAVEQGADGGFKVDWETEVCYLPMAWQDFTMQKHATTVDMRVLARPDNHYNTEFSEDKEYVCFRMVSRDSKVPVYGYAKRNSPVWHDLRLFFTGKRQTSTDGEPLILRLRIPENGFARNGVIIERFLSDRWLYVDPSRDTRGPKAIMATAER